MMKVFIILGALCTMMSVGTGALVHMDLKENSLINICQYGKSSELSNVSWSRINYDWHY